MKGLLKNPTCRLGGGPKDAGLEARESGALSRHSRDNSLGRDGVAELRACHKTRDTATEEAPVPQGLRRFEITAE